MLSLLPRTASLAATSIWPRTSPSTLFISRGPTFRLNSLLPIHTPSINPKYPFGGLCHAHKAVTASKKDSVLCLVPVEQLSSAGLESPKEVGP